MTPQQLLELFRPIDDPAVAQETWPVIRPLLAHYTTIETLARVMSGDELWLSNPLFMNDHEEIRFGIENGMFIARASSDLKTACGDDDRVQRFFTAFEQRYQVVANKNVLDYYVLCLSLHDRDDDDGVLSMWRAYGGNGNGAALVFDAAQLGENRLPFLILGKVTYLSTSQRLSRIENVVSQFASILAGGGVPTGDLHMAAWILFEKLKLDSLFIKHHGFKEEKEWRLVYLGERDEEGHLTSMLSYSVGKRGIEPRLKLKIQPIAGVTAPDLSLAKLLDRILLGPSVSHTLAFKSIAKMLVHEGKPDFVEKLRASTIPLRPTI